MSKWEINSWLCIFDIKNEQSEYSYLAELIRTLEGLAFGRSDGQKPELSGFRITRVPADANDSVQAAEDRLKNEDSRLVRVIENWEMLEGGLVREPSVKGFSYYIRVDTGGESSDLSNFRYLVLLMQSMPEVCRKLKVLFRADEEEQKGAYAHYNRLSQFLRFVQMGYRAFYASLGGGIRPLAMRAEIPRMFVPLLEINRETYRWHPNKGIYKTDEYGRIVLSDLKPGTVITAKETATVDGFVLDGTPKSIEIEAGEGQTLTFYNAPVGGLELIKVNEADKTQRIPNTTL